MLTAVVVGGETVRGFETVRRTKAGRLIHVSLTISPLTEGHGIAGASVIAHDITDRVELEAQLLQQAMHDALTGLPNRALLQERLAQALREAERDGAPVAVLFCDIDRLKTVNDARGHLVGDRLLVEVARRFQAVTRPGDTVARWGGDEFVVVCKATEENEAEHIAERIRTALRAPIDLYGQLLHATMSVGIAAAPPLPADADTLLRHADAAMYEAKARGRGRSHVSDRRGLERSREELDLIGDLRRALEDEDLEVHYQPVLDLATGELSGLEALTRWRHGSRGEVVPDVFVRLAENNGLVERLDRWVLQQACAAAKRFAESGHLPPQAKVGVNLSASTLCDPGLPTMVQDTLTQVGLSPGSLMVEVTETDVLKDAVTAGQSLQALRGLGAAVALDDFGTGYSSLSFVRTLPVTHLKIDRSFVENITHDADDLTITASVIDLAHGLGISTIAEGVQTSEQLEKLRALGCRAGQGFFWSPARPLAEVADWLDSRRTEPTAGPGGSRVYP
jgi:diguanylate cyclase (GGDEF)-like protein